MKMNTRILAVVSCMAFCLAASSTLHAATYTINGSFWNANDSTLVDPSWCVYITPFQTCGTRSNPGTIIDPLSTTPNATFTLAGNGTNSFSLFNLVNMTYADENLSQFLTSGGDSVAFLTGGSYATYGPGNPYGVTGLDDTLYRFTGTVDLTEGIYAFQHDDGIVLYLNGIPVISNQTVAGPNDSATTYLCVGSSSYCSSYTSDPLPGTYNFTLDYSDVVYWPSRLQATMTPEPNSLLLLGSGLAAALAALRRRMFN